MLDLRRIELIFVTDGDVDLPQLRQDIINMMSEYTLGVWFEHSSQREIRGQDYADVVEALSIDIPHEDWLEWADMKHDQRGDRP